MCVASEIPSDSVVYHLHRYEISRASEVSAVDASRHPASFSAKLVAFGREYRLEAQRHDALLHPEYGEYVVDADGSVTRTESTTSLTDHCHYQGVIVGAGGEHEGHAALSICDGLRGQILGVDGTDWAQTLHDAVALGPSAGALSLFLYIVRHGALYYALGKWLLEWNRQLFDADVGPSPENVTE